MPTLFDRRVKLEQSMLVTIKFIVKGPLNWIVDLGTHLKKGGDDKEERGGDFLHLLEFTTIQK